MCLWCRAWLSRRTAQPTSPLYPHLFHTRSIKIYGHQGLIHPHCCTWQWYAGLAIKLYSSAPLLLSFTRIRMSNGSTLFDARALMSHRHSAEEKEKHVHDSNLIDSSSAFSRFWIRRVRSTI